MDGRVGVYGVASWPLGDNITVFGRAGYAKETIAFKVPAIRIDEERSSGSFAAGVGAEFMFDDSNGIRADYLYAPDFEGESSFSFGSVRRF